MKCACWGLLPSTLSWPQPSTFLGAREEGGMGHSVPTTSDPIPPSLMSYIPARLPGPPASSPANPPL